MFSIVFDKLVQETQNKFVAVVVIGHVSVEIKQTLIGVKYPSHIVTEQFVCSGITGHPSSGLQYKS